MDIPRLIIADERRTGFIPPAVLIISAMQQMGYPVRIFVSEPDEELIQILQLVCSQPVTVIDPFLCGSQKTLKILFQHAAQKDAINFIVAPLGERQREDTLTVSSDTLEIARALGCGIVPVLYGDTSATLTARSVEHIVSQCNGIAGGGASILAILYMSVFNPREYQLLEIEQGRKTPLIGLGYIPKYLERESVSLLQLLLEDRGRQVALSLKTAAAQLIALVDQVEWATFATLSRIDEKFEAVSDSNRRQLPSLTVGIYDHPAFCLNGDNATQLFSYLGCSVEKFSELDEKKLHNADALYIPHGMGFLAAEMLIGSKEKSNVLKNLFLSRKPIFVNGGAAPLFGSRFALSQDRSYEGLSLFDFESKYNFNMSQRESLKYHINAFTRGIFFDRGGKARGYSVPYLSISSQDSLEKGLWSCIDAESLKETSQTGWEIGYGAVSHVVLELWSCIEAVVHWLTLRKR